MRLIDYFRPALQESQEVKAIQDGIQAAVDKLWADVEDCTAQLNVETATWGLSIWEEALGLPVQVERPMAFRRSRIKAKRRGHGTIKVEVVQNVAASFANGDVEVIEIPEEYLVEIHFLSAVALPPNLNDLMNAIDEIIPAHLAVKYTATIKTWGDVKTLDWDYVKEQSWGWLRGEVT